jgi:hypothetical protein
LAERRHHRPCPVDRANEVTDARDQPKQERAKRRLTRETLSAARTLDDALDRPAAQRDEQWNDRDPRNRRMTELGKTEREQNARGQS